jgi:hypothetical protein
LGGGQSFVQDQGLVDLLFHRVQRVERRHGLLEDHGDLVAPHPAQQLLVGADQLATLKPHRAAGGMARQRVGKKL